MNLFHTPHANSVPRIRGRARRVSAASAVKKTLNEKSRSSVLLENVRVAAVSMKVKMRDEEIRDKR